MRAAPLNYGDAEGSPFEVLSKSCKARTKDSSLASTRPQHRAAQTQHRWTLQRAPPRKPTASTLTLRSNAQRTRQTSLGCKGASTAGSFDALSAGGLLPNCQHPGRAVCLWLAPAVPARMGLTFDQPCAEPWWIAAAHATAELP